MSHVDDTVGEAGKCGDPHLIWGREFFQGWDCKLWLSLGQSSCWKKGWSDSISQQVKIGIKTFATHPLEQVWPYE
jgi:hypothetical protein